jgi:hypothetical protein
MPKEPISWHQGILAAPPVIGKSFFMAADCGVNGCRKQQRGCVNLGAVKMLELLNKQTCAIYHGSAHGVNVDEKCIGAKIQQQNFPGEIFLNSAPGQECFSNIENIPKKDKHG